MRDTLPAMRRTRPGLTTVTLSLAALLGACSGSPSGPSDALTFTFDFHLGPQGFTAGFADYPPAHAEIYELLSDYRALPAPLEPNSALFISGVNRSDDLFMFFKGPIGGLRPGALYGVTVGAGDRHRHAEPGASAWAARRARASGSRPARPRSNRSWSAKAPTCG